MSTLLRAMPVLLHFGRTRVLGVLTGLGLVGPLMKGMREASVVRVDEVLFHVRLEDKRSKHILCRMRSNSARALGPCHCLERHPAFHASSLFHVRYIPCLYMSSRL